MAGKDVGRMSLVVLVILAGTSHEARTGRENKRLS